MISEVVNSLLQIFANASAGECIAVSTSVLYRAVCSNTRNQGSKWEHHLPALLRLETATPRPGWGSECGQQL